MKLKLPAGRFAAYLFDCDGTIADSMPLHYVAWKKALSEWNCEFDEEIFYAWGGMPVAEIISTLNEKHGLNMPVEAVSRRKEGFYFELLPQLKPVPEAWPASIRSSFGKHQGVGGCLSHCVESAGSIRHPGLCRRLREEQARSGSFSAGRHTAGSGAGSLSGFRRHGNGRASGDDGGYGCS